MLVHLKIAEYAISEISSQINLNFNSCSLRLISNFTGSKYSQPSLSASSLFPVLFLFNKLGIWGFSINYPLILSIWSKKR
jgi:hypothetical protein